jgi:hypothetical protein
MLVELRSVAKNLVTALGAVIVMINPDRRSEPPIPPPMNLLLLCAPHASATVAPFAWACGSMGWGPLRWLNKTAPEPQLQPGEERLWVLPDELELVDWVDRFAAHRLPTLLVLPGGPRLRPEAALHQALLTQAGVPLLGLLQVGGEWEPQLRRSEALPWLGHWQPGDRQALALQAPLAVLLRQRLLELDLT